MLTDNRGSLNLILAFLHVYRALPCRTHRLVDTHVTNLRKKIEPHPAQPCFLIGVRGLGYRFDG